MSCDANLVYTVGGVENQADSGTIREVNTTTGATSIIGSFGVSSYQTNALAITSDASTAYALTATSGTFTQYNLRKYVSATNTATTATTVGAVHGIPAGGIDPSTGYYWYGGPLNANPNAWGFSAVDLATNTDLGLQFTATAPANTGGDLAFDSRGNMYVAITAGNGNAAQNQLLRFGGPLVNDGSSMTGTVLTNLAPPSQVFNGIAFVADGYLYAQSGENVGNRTLRRLDPATGAQISTVAVMNGANGTDLASCGSPSVLEVQKDIESRYAPTDQFALTIDGVSTANSTGLTSGDSPGIQEGDEATAGPVLVLPGTTYAFREEGASGANLDNYQSSYLCVDQNTSTTVAEGSGTTGTVTIPNSAAEGASVRCTFSNRVLDEGLSIVKTSDATSDTRAGDTVTYTVTASNADEVDYTAERPAVFFDDLSGVLDDADYNNDAVADRPGAVSFASPLLSWTGALAVGESVTLTYTVTLTGGGDGRVRNMAWQPHDPTNPVPPACHPPDVDGMDTDTGEPCAEVEHLLPRLSVEKTADRTELPAVGDQVRYTVTATNVGPGVYTGGAPATVTDDLTDVVDAGTFNDDAAASSGTVSVAGPILSWSGALGAAESVTITYSVTYTGAGDMNLRNDVCVPVLETAPGKQRCDFVAIPGAGLTQWKQVQASTSLAAAGTVLTYTLFFGNDGEVAADVDAVDDLTHVTDDGDVTTEPTSPDGLTVGRAGNRISVTGSVPAGETFTVTYQVTLKADGARGDDTAANFLLPPDQEPPTDPVCVPTDERFPDCTTTLIAAIDYRKSVEASTAPVAAGTVLTYTVTVQNTGKVPSPVSRQDVLTDVLDDADLTSGPTSDTGSVTVSAVTDGRFRIGGDLPTGTTAVITYRATLKADADRGNDQADNFLVPPGGTPPAACVDGSGLCTSTRIPLIGVGKSADPATGSAVQAGQQIAFTLTFTNTGRAAGPAEYTDNLAGVLDDADLTGAPVSSDAGLVPTSGADGLVRVTGTLQPDQTVTVSYTVTVKPDGARGDNRLRNLVATTGTENPQCGVDGVECTEHLIGELDDWKTADPPTGSIARPGQTVTYTLHFENTGHAPVAVNRDDVLTKVLDDAAVTSQPVASSGALTVPAIENGRLTVTGTLQPGDQVTVTYAVTVKADGQRGDDRLANFLVPGGAEPPENCVLARARAERPDCTDNHVSDVAVVKSSNPTSRSTVNPGEEVTYTLTFTNRGTNPDAAAVSVDYTDHMADVLDDATLTAGPTVSHERLTAVAGGDTIRVTAAVPTGARYTVTYTVKVKDYDQQGNHHLGNVVALTGEPPVCVPDSPLCTAHEASDPPSPGARSGWGGSLPITGAQISPAVLVTALVLLGVGGGYLLIGRRRRATATTDNGAGQNIGIDDLF